MLLVIHIASLHAQHGIQIVGSHNGVTHPSDLTDIVFISLVEFHMDIHVLVIIGAHGIYEDGGIAESQFVVFLNQGQLSILIALIGEFL